MLKKRIIILLLLAFTVVAGLSANTNPTYYDLTGVWDCVGNNQTASINQIGNRLYILIEGNQVKNISVGTVIGNVVTLEICNDIPGSINHGFTNEGKGIISSDGSTISWSGGFLNNISWSKISNW